VCGPPWQHIGADLDPRRRQLPGYRIDAALHGRQQRQFAVGAAQRRGQFEKRRQAALIGEEVRHHVVDRVEALVAVRADGPARRRRHQSQRGPHTGEPMLFGPVVKRVPAQILGIATFGMASRHRNEQRADLTAPRGKHTVDLV
jgi:hypothetical protein